MRDCTTVAVHVMVKGQEAVETLPPAAAPAAEVTSAAAGAVGGGGIEWRSMGEVVGAGGRRDRIEADIRELALHVFVFTAS